MASVLLIVIASALYLGLYGSSNFSWNMMGQTWGGMFHNDHHNGINSYSGGQPSGAAIYWIFLVPLVAITIVGIVGVGFYLVYPEIKRSPESHSLVSQNANPAEAKQSSSQHLTDIDEPNHITSLAPTRVSLVSPVPNTVSPAPQANPNWDFLMKTSRPDERKILDILASHEGTYLQKLIAKESGLGKLKTHRIIARLEEREIVNVVESGNTNQVSLAKWVSLTQNKPSEQENSKPPSFTY